MIKESGPGGAVSKNVVDVCYRVFFEMLVLELRKMIRLTAAGSLPTWLRNGRQSRFFGRVIEDFCRALLLGV